MIVIDLLRRIDEQFAINFLSQWMRNERIMRIVKRDAQYSGILLIGRPIIEHIDAPLDQIGIRHGHLLSGRHINIFFDEFRPFFAINENAQMLDTVAAIINQRFIILRIVCGTGTISHSLFSMTNPVNLRSLRAPA